MTFITDKDKKVNKFKNMSKALLNQPDNRTEADDIVTMKELLDKYNITINRTRNRNV